jgi:NAD(P)-dependent dehydrogenase (short-subunit alcohol dehydrogenase family)
VDVTSESDVAGTLDLCERRFGSVDGVVNSAGTGTDCPALDTSVDVFRRILDVNLIGSFVVAREAARRMIARGRGSIVNIASASGVRGNVGRTAYGASKGGVIALTRVLAVEWAAHGIRVNAVAPGPVDTPLSLRVHTDEVRSKWLSSVPMRRYGTPMEVAAATLFLLNPAQSSYMTGETLRIDGGFSMAGLMPNCDGQPVAPERSASLDAGDVLLPEDQPSQNSIWLTDLARCSICSTSSRMSAASFAIRSFDRRSRMAAMLSAATGWPLESRMAKPMAPRPAMICP